MSKSSSGAVAGVRLLVQAVLIAAIVGALALWISQLRGAQLREASAIALHKAVQASDLDAVRRLAREGADIDVHYGGGSLLYQSLWDGHVAMAYLLMQLGAKTTADPPDTCGNLLLVACKRNPPDSITKAKLAALIDRFLSDGEDVNCADSTGFTPLHGASYSGKVEVVKQLVDRGARVNVLDSNGNSPLFLAAKNNQLEISKILLDHGASASVENRKGQSPLKIAVLNHNTAVSDLLRARLTITKK
jgi:hypothetical protein